MWYHLFINMKNEILLVEQMEREQFMRIANARLKSVYRFVPQRIAMAAVMFRRWAERKEQLSKTGK